MTCAAASLSLNESGPPMATSRPLLKCGFVYASQPHERRAEHERRRDPAIFVVVGDDADHQAEEQGELEDIDDITAAALRIDRQERA